MGRMPSRIVKNDSRNRVCSTLSGLDRIITIQVNFTLKKENLMVRNAAVLLTVVLLASAATAAIEPGDGLLIVNAGYATGELSGGAGTGEGGIIAVTFEKLDWDKPASMYFNLGYSEISSEMTMDINGEMKSVTEHVNTLPMFIGGKGYLGEGSLQGYVGLSFGVYFTRVERAVTNTGENFTKWHSMGLGMGVPIGLNLSVGKTLFLNANYTLNWLWGNDALKDNAIHTANLGIGFKTGK